MIAGSKYLRTIIAHRDMLFSISKGLTTPNQVRKLSIKWRISYASMGQDGLKLKMLRRSAHYRFTDPGVCCPLRIAKRAT